MKFICSFDILKILAEVKIDIFYFYAYLRNTVVPEKKLKWPYKCIYNDVYVPQLLLQS